MMHRNNGLGCNGDGVLNRFVDIHCIGSTDRKQRHINIFQLFHLRYRIGIPGMVNGLAFNGNQLLDQS